MQTPSIVRLEEFCRQKGIHSLTDLAKQIGASTGTFSIINKRGSRPGNKVMDMLIAKFPDLSREWVLDGIGPMFRNGQALTPIARVTPAAEEPAAPAQTLHIPNAVNNLLDEIIKQANHYRGELKEQREGYERRLAETTKHWQYTVDRMEATIKNLEAEVSRLQLLSGQRMPTAEEAEAMERQASAAKRPTVKGLRSYEEVGHEEAYALTSTPGGLPLAKTRPRADEEVSFLRIAA